MKVVKNKSMVMFETNDDRSLVSSEYGRYSGDRYKKPFSDFIESLGYIIGANEHSLDQININGYDFGLNVDNASYMSKNGWSREVSVRKPKNRFIVIEHVYGKNTILKIELNKEYEADKLRAKIDAAIQARIEREQEQVNGEIADKTNMTAIAKHFMSKEDFKQIVSNISVREGKILFNISSSTLTCKPTGEFIEYDIYKREIKDESILSDMFHELYTLREKTEKILNIVKHNPIDNNLIEWVTKTYSKSYDVVKSEYCKY